MRSFETTDKFYDIPPLAFDVLHIEHANGSVEKTTAGMVKRVKVTAGGVTLKFLSGGGKEMHEAIRLVYKEPPKPEKKPEVVAGPPPITLLKDHDSTAAKPQQVQRVMPPPMPKGESVKVRDQADAIVEKK